MNSLKSGKVGIVLKRGSKESAKLADRLSEWFAARNIVAVIDRIEEDLDMLVILGGDGTLLHVADPASRLQIPVVGVNLGGLGFLTELEVGDCLDAIEAILAGAVAIENRMMIRARLHSAGQECSWGHGLNDVVVTKGDVDHLVQLICWANKEYIATYRADGLIISTPTGSTAYNLSAGGPIVHPALHALLVTPICPFMLESRPVLLPSNFRLSIRPAGQVSDVKIIVDGQLVWSMKEMDTLEVEVSDKPLKLITSPRRGYFEILRSKLSWGGKDSPPFSE